MINCSLVSGVIPAELKMAEVTPILKKTALDHLNMGYRPISNLTFLSKVLERVVASHLQTHLDANGLFEPFLDFALHIALKLPFLGWSMTFFCLWIQGKHF